MKEQILVFKIKKYFIFKIGQDCFSVMEEMLSDGDRALSDIRAMLRTWNLTDEQLKMTEVMLKSQLRQLYKNDIFKDEKRIRRMENVNLFNKSIYIACPRFSGKTHVFVIFVICLLLSVKNVRITIFQEWRRWRMHILDTIRSFVYDFEIKVIEARGQFIATRPRSNDDDTIRILVNGNDSRSVRVLDVKTELSRGPADFIFCDNADRLNIEFSELIMKWNNVIFIGCLGPYLTTLNDGSSTFSSSFVNHIIANPSLLDVHLLSDMVTQGWIPEKEREWIGRLSSR